MCFFAQSYSYNYDTIGNRKSATEGLTSTSYAANLVNQYSAINATAPTYDDDGNLLSVSSGGKPECPNK